MIQPVSSDDRRKEQRFSINANVKIMTMDGQYTYYGNCCDVSSSGLKVELLNDLPEGQLYKLEIEEEDVICVAEATVAHSVKIEGGFVIGFQVDFESELPK